MEFPRERFARVGATPEELDGFEAGFQALSPVAQQSMLDRVAPMPDTGVLALLEDYRSHNAELPAEPDSEPDPEPAPAAASSSAAKSSAPAAPEPSTE